MTAETELAVERMRREHDYLSAQVLRIKSLCAESGSLRSCRACAPVRREVCQENVEQLIRNFVESTLRHNLAETVYMVGRVPLEHRQAHLRAHLAIGEELKAIRLVFSEDGNCVQAIEGVDRALALLDAHAEEFDEPLERYLQAV